MATWDGVDWSRRADRCAMVCCTVDDLGGINVAARKYAGICFASAVLAGCALGLAPTAQADCDPFLLSMTPQPVLSCEAPDVPPPPDQPALAPVNDAPPPAEVLTPAEPGPFGYVVPPPPGA
jgi:hypothetical protein